MAYAPQPASSGPLPFLFSGAVIQPPVLSTLTASASGAFSLRLLNSSYAGNAINVRRSSDNTTQDIGFDSRGNLNTTSLLAFVGSGSGYVATWYDQSGHANNLVQSTTTSQSQIVNSGVINLSNNLPTMTFSGGQVIGNSTWNGVTQPFTSNAVFLVTNTITLQAIVGALTSGANDLFTQSGSFKIYGTNPLVSSVSFSNSTLYVGTGMFNGSSSSIALNGTVDSGTLGNSTTSGFSVGNDAGTQYMTGSVSEVTVFGSILGTTDRQKLERNQGYYYRIGVR